MSTTALGATFPLAGPAVRPGEDAELLASLGLSAVRVPLAWASLVPKAGAVAEPAVEAARDALQAFRSRGTAVWVTLLDGEPPGWFLDEGGFGDAKAAGRWWPRYVELATEAVGDLVDGWVPIVDPVGYGRRAQADPERHAHLQRQLVVSWRDAWRLLRGGPPVATCLGLGVVRAADATVPARDAARRLDDLVWRTWPLALRDGTVSVPGLADLVLADLAGAADVLGGRFRAPLDVEPDRWADDVAAMARRLAEQGPAGIDLHLTLALRGDDAARRGALVDGSLAAVHAAVADGVPVRAVWAEPAVGAAASGALADLDRVPTDLAERWHAGLG